MTHRPTRVKRPGAMLAPWQRKTEVRPDASVVALLRAEPVPRVYRGVDYGFGDKSVTTAVRRTVAERIAAGEITFKLDGARGSVDFSKPVRLTPFNTEPDRALERLVDGARKQLGGANSVARGVTIPAGWTYVGDRPGRLGMYEHPHGCLVRAVNDRFLFWRASKALKTGRAVYRDGECDTLRAACAAALAGVKTFYPGERVRAKLGERGGGGLESGVVVGSEMRDEGADEGTPRLCVRFKNPDRPGVTFWAYPESTERVL